MPDALFTVPYPEHSFFVGREDELARLHAALQGEGPVGINPAALGNPTGVTGQGGIGKTQLAVAYAYRYRAAYADGVYWLNAANDWRVEFAKLADDLNPPAAGGPVNLDTADRQRLSRVLAACAGLQGGPAARAAFLEIAGLKRFVAGLDLNGSTREVANGLVVRLESYGFLPNQPTHHSLGALLEYVAGLDDTPSDDGRWLQEIIGRYRLITTATTSQSQDERVMAAFAWLRNHPNALLILDNLADPAALDESLARDCVPGRLPGRLLFTTRRRDLGRFQPVELKTLPPDKALLLLLRDPRRAPALDPAHREHATARDICATFGYLPLALEIAAAHLAKFHAAPLSAYRDELRRRGARDVLADRHVTVETRHKTGLDAALEAQWATLGQEAQTVLRVAGQFPEAAYVPVARLGLLGGVPDEGQSFFDVTLVGALAELNDASLIEELAANEARLHPLVREFARDRTPPGEKAAFRAECVRRLLGAFGDIETLERQCDRRGIDALIRDLLATSELLDEAGAPEIGRDLQAQLRVLRREAHNLRGWRREDAPGFLAQLLQLRLFDSATPALFGDLAARLRSAGPAWRPRWAARSVSPALEMAMTGHTDWVNAVALTPDGRRAVSGGGDRTLRVWNLDTGDSERTLAGHTRGVNAVALTADGRRAVSGGEDGTLRVWNLDTGDSERTLAGHVGGVRAVALTPDGRRAVSAGRDRTLRVWNLDTGDSERTLAGHAGAVWAVALTPDGRRAVSGGEDGTLRVWNLDTGDSERTLAGHADWVRAVALTADGRRAVSGGQDGTLRVWNLDTGDSERTLAGHAGWVVAVALTADGRRAVSGGDDGTLRVWNLDTGDSARTLAGHAGWVLAVALTADGRRAVSGGGDGTVRVWNVDAGRELARAALDAGVECVAVAPGQPALVVAGDAAGNVYCLEWVE